MVIATFTVCPVAQRNLSLLILILRKVKAGLAAALSTEVQRQLQRLLDCILLVIQRHPCAASLRGGVKARPAHAS